MPAYRYAAKTAITMTINATAARSAGMLTISGIRDAEVKALAAELDLIELA
ncbi:hypothetical protein L9G74_18205 [Shewanella sp. C32]|uniref:Uncharacterized protein n=1 Tax=Shewanella electrica TaxID=515560 RepID=A0ABT2FPV4_9GAMM|nr:hypothetical protein [Shewanella electrica]MCH1926813.1 hypothetical protein [Shewanella electrica]MCS4558374.1 hypothetical protein [Shewanella electrica]